MPLHAMTPHYSGTTLDAQQRYAAGVKEVLRRTFEGEELNETDVIVKVRCCLNCMDHAQLACSCWPIGKLALLNME